MPRGNLSNCGKVRGYGGFGGKRESFSRLADLGRELLEPAGHVQGEKPCRGGGDDVRVANASLQHRHSAGSCSVLLLAGEDPQLTIEHEPTPANRARLMLYRPTPLRREVVSRLWP